MSNEASGRGELPTELEQLTELARESRGRMSPEQSVRGELSLSERLRARRTARKVWLMPAAVAAFSGLALVSALVFQHGLRFGRSNLSYVVENAASAADQSLNVDGGPPRVVRFSDGSEYASSGARSLGFAL